MSKIAIINCFDTYEERVDLLQECFTDLGHSVTVVQSNFRHIKKKFRTEVKQDYIFVKTKTYSRNMSIRRMYSHYDFAKKAISIIEKMAPDLIYVLLPPNSLAKFAANYKRRNTQVKLIFDLMDLWPETMPVGRIKKMTPFKQWRLLRDNYINYADFIITECNLYQSVLSKTLKCNTDTVYLAKKPINLLSSRNMLTEKEIHLCYLGSINNIIDIQRIKTFVHSLNNIKLTTLHVIGDGESRDFFLNEIKSTGARVIFYGKVFDLQSKQDIFDKCHLALNIMKENVCVGLTMKSIDYFQHGLPLVNNIKSDTTEIIDHFKNGFNISDVNFNETIYKIANTSLEEFIEMRNRSLKAYLELFSYEVFQLKMNKIIEQVNGD